MTDYASSKIPYPHHINHETKEFYIKVSNWMSALGASKLLEKWYPSYKCVLVSEERLEEVKIETK